LEESTLAASPGRLSGKVILVTGAGQGIGRGIALACAAEGADLVVSGRTFSKVETVAKEIEERGVRALALECDVMDKDSVDAMVAASIERFGQIDGLVNNAQTVALGPILELTEKGVDKTFRSGFMGSLWCMQAAHPHLAKTKGSIINLGSGSAFIPDSTGFAVYAGTKEAIRMLSRTAAVEWGKDGIRVNTLTPNGMSPGLEMWSKFDTEGFEKFRSSIPLGRVGDCELDVGRAAVFLLSEDAAYVTGSTLMVDGGQAFHQ
jgi:NAD(P)-dependent dehydrogenase (short-subunit alcohol dehydrogenase family)